LIASLRRSDGDGRSNKRGFLGERTPVTLSLGDLLSDQSGKFAVDLLFVAAVADAADEEIGTMADKESIWFAPVNKLEIVRFHDRTSRIADLTSFS
jgi:hypothetical protein